MEINEYFNTKEPYKIAERITKGSELSCDLVAHVFELMIKKNQTFKNIGAFFNVAASKQWRLPNSEFNKLYRPHFMTEFDESFMSIEDDEIIHLDHFRDFMKSYLKQSTNNPVEWFTKEIAKMIIKGKTYRQIQSETGINTAQITKSIKKFKDDVLHSYQFSIDRDDSSDV